MTVFLGVGANLGDPLETIIQAWSLLSSDKHLHELKSSHVYWTEPVSSISQPWYLNCVWSFSTSYSSLELFDLLQGVEKKLGKFPKPKEAPRFLDLDILLFNDERINTESLQIPHPKWKERGFVLVPLGDLTDSVHIPGEGELKIADLILANQDPHRIQKKYDRSVVCRQ